MNKCKRMFVVIILLFLNGLSSANENSMTARVMFEKAASSPSVPGISVAIANKDGIIWSEGFGYSDLENEVAMTKNTKLRIGSIAKVITAAGLMRLYDQGKIDLDDDIRGLVSEWPKKHEKITLRQLTSHTSGIRHYKSEEEFLSNVKYKNTIDALNIFKDDQLEFKPGTEFGYSTFA